MGEDGRAVLDGGSFVRKVDCAERTSCGELEETGKAPVSAGDILFLPRKQLHSLECTDQDGMLLLGVIYPGNNPSINY